MFSASRSVRRAPRPRTLGLRLLLGYTAVFAASAVLLFGLQYVLFLRLMSEPDRVLTQAQARSLAAAYAGGGLTSMQAVLADEAAAERMEEFVVRVADAAGRTVLLYNPDNWKQSELARLERHPPLPGEEAWLRLGTGEDRDALGAYVIRLPDGAVLQVGTDAEIRRDVLISMRKVFLALALPVLALALLGGGLLSYRALRPVRRLVHTLQAVIETGDVSRRVQEHAERGEFADLVQLFNRMLDRIQALVQGMRDTLDNVAHDLRTPMARLRGRAELALSGQADDAAYRESLAECIEASDAVLDMLNTVMDVAEAEAGAMLLRMETIPAHELIGGVLSVYDLLAEEKGVELVADVPPGLTVTADRSRMRQVIANLLDNAIKYTPPGGRVRIDAGRDEEGVRIQVQDSGIGIAPDDLPRIWDRLYRGDRSRSERGLGLGLSLVRAVVTAHGGQVAAESAPGGGSTFMVWLPDRTRNAGRAILSKL